MTAIAMPVYQRSLLSVTMVCTADSYVAEAQIWPRTGTSAAVGSHATVASCEFRRMPVHDSG